MERVQCLPCFGKNKLTPVNITFPANLGSSPIYSAIMNHVFSLQKGNVHIKSILGLKYHKNMLQILCLMALSCFAYAGIEKSRRISRINNNVIIIINVYVLLHASTFQFMTCFDTPGMILFVPQRKKPYKKLAGIGVPGWPSWLSVQLLVSTQVVVLGSDFQPCNVIRLCAQRGVCLRFSLPLSPCTFSLK